MFSPIQWLVGSGVVYMLVGSFNITYRFMPIVLLHTVWLIVLCIPVYFPVKRLVQGAPFVTFDIVSALARFLRK